MKLGLYFYLFSCSLFHFTLPFHLNPLPNKRNTLTSISYFTRLQDISFLPIIKPATSNSINKSILQSASDKITNHEVNSTFHKEKSNVNIFEIKNLNDKINYLVQGKIEKEIIQCKKSHSHGAVESKLSEKDYQMDSRNTIPRHDNQFYIKKLYDLVIPSLKDKYYKYLNLEKYYRSIDSSSSYKNEMPLQSLKRGIWFKLICGASYQDVTRIRYLAFIYTLAGIDCIDVCAEEAVISAAIEGMDMALTLLDNLEKKIDSYKKKDELRFTDKEFYRPWLMVSISDDEDAHFRKASFDSNKCPPDCPQPCVSVCPTNAIGEFTIDDYNDRVLNTSKEGVQFQNKCYGCGRCMNNICPLGLIVSKSFTHKPSYVKELIKKQFPSSYATQKSHKFVTIDAIEIHSGMREKDFLKRSRFATENNAYQKGKVEEATSKSQKSFELLWKDLEDVIPDLKAVAISFPYLEDKVPTFQLISHRRNTMLRNSLATCSKRNDTSKIPKNIIWQTDGRPMSGDIGKGSTQQCVKFGSYVLKEALPRLKFHTEHKINKQEILSTQEFIQLAGGTNEHTMTKLREGNLTFSSNQLNEDRMDRRKDFDGSEEGLDGKEGQKSYINGIAFGGYARKLLEPYFDLFEFEKRFRKDDLMNISNCAYEIYEITSKAKELVDKVKDL